MEIIPIRDLKNTSEISEKCHKSREPIFVTKNGYSDLVVMSMETYKRKMAMADFDEKIREAENDISEGVEPLDARSALAELRAKYVK